MSVEGSPTRQLQNQDRPTDREGFYISQAQEDANVDDSGEAIRLSKKALETERRRERKWLEMLNRWDDWMLQNPKKIKSRCRKGIPASLRGRAWSHLCGANKLMENNIGVFDDFQAQADALAPDSPLQEFMEVIERDLDRTFPHNERFSVRGGDGQAELRKILRAYCMYNQETGYCQGMGMLVGTLLMQMPTEESFWCTVAMLDQYVKGYFDSGLKEIQICSNTLHGLIGRTNAGLFRHMDEQGMIPLLYATDWFMCCYVKTLPWGTVLRVWDMFFFEGDKIFFRVALAVLGMSKNKLLKECPDQMEMMQYLRNLPPAMLWVQKLIPAMLKLPLKRDTIEQIRESGTAQYLKEHPAEAEKEAAAAAALAAPAPSPAPSPALALEEDGPQRATRGSTIIAEAQL